MSPERLCSRPAPNLAPHSLAALRPDCHALSSSGPLPPVGAESQDDECPKPRFRGPVDGTWLGASSSIGTLHFARLLQRPRLYLLLILALGGWLRFQNLDWGNGYHFQPDEGTLIGFAQRLQPPYNPYRLGHYAYGGLPLYLYHFTGEGLGWLLGDRAWTGDWHLTMVARCYAASLSTLTIALVYALGAWRAGRWAGILAAAVASVSVLAIQYAHYGVADTLLAFLTALTALVSTRLLDRGRTRDYVLAGVVTGLACATKATGLVSIVFPVTAHLLRGRHQPRPIRFVLIDQLPKLLTFSLAVVVAVVLTSPYYVFDYASFRRAMTKAGLNIISEEGQPTWTWQFTGATPYLYELRQLVRWSLGIPLGVAGLFGYLYLLLCIIQRDVAAKSILLLSGPTLYFAIVGTWHAKFIRYLLPTIPFLCSFAGVVMWEARQLTRPFWLRRLTGVLTATVGSLSLLYSVAFVQVYRSPDARLQASQWLVEHLEPGAPILHDPEPNIVLPLNSRSAYDIRMLDYYPSDRLQQAGYFADSLEGRQHIIIASRRNYATLMRLADSYPVAACFYQALFSGALGFSLAQEFTSYPRIASLEINTDSAEETFQVFDHPRVLLFERTQDLSRQDLLAALSCDPGAPMRSPP